MLTAHVGTDCPPEESTEPLLISPFLILFKGEEEREIKREEEGYDIILKRQFLFFFLHLMVIINLHSL